MAVGFPSASDIQTFLEGTGYPLPPLLDYTQLAASVKARFLQDTGQRIIERQNNLTRYFDPPGGAGVSSATPRGGARILLLDAPLIAIHTLSVDGVAKFSPLDYTIRGNDAPFNIIEFTFPVFCQPKGIAINADWGIDPFPDDVFQACVDYSGVMVGPRITALIHKGQMSTREGDEQVVSGSGNSKSMYMLDAQAWKDEWIATTDNWGNMLAYF